MKILYVFRKEKASLFEHEHAQGRALRVPHQPVEDGRADGAASDDHDVVADGADLLQRLAVVRGDRVTVGR